MAEMKDEEVGGYPLPEFSYALSKKIVKQWTHGFWQPSGNCACD